MTPNRHGSAVFEFPSELEIVTTREFDAPIALVFDVFTNPEHVRHWFAPFADVVTECSIDLRVGGSYHILSVTPDGTESSGRPVSGSLAVVDRAADCVAGEVDRVRRRTSRDDLGVVGIHVRAGRRHG